MRSPYLISKKGIGIIARVMNPKSELPQPRPRAPYMGWPARGSTAPKTDRQIVLAAIAEAA